MASGNDEHNLFQGMAIGHDFSQSNYYHQYNYWSTTLPLDPDLIIRNRGQLVARPSRAQLQVAAYGSYVETLGNLTLMRDEFQKLRTWDQQAWLLLLHLTALNRPIVVGPVITTLRSYNWMHECDYILETSLQRAPSDVIQIARILPQDLKFSGLRKVIKKRSSEDIVSLMPFIGGVDSKSFELMLVLYRPANELATVMQLLKKSRFEAHKNCLRMIKYYSDYHPSRYELIAALSRLNMTAEAKAVRKRVDGRAWWP